MVKEAAEQNRFNLWLPFCAAIGAFIAFLPAVIYRYDMGEILYFFVIAPIVSLILFVIAVLKKRRQRLSVLSMLAVYCAISCGLFVKSYDIRTASRWFLWSKRYKAEVLSQPRSANGELRHIEWDGWGFPGAGDTVVYLVFDPSDSLSAAMIKSHSPGKFSGIPCEVYRVRRLENYWYSVVFYTDTDWGHCSSSFWPPIQTLLGPIQNP